jgi:hypothetical protein
MRRRAQRIETIRNEYSELSYKDNFKTSASLCIFSMYKHYREYC